MRTLALPAELIDALEAAAYEEGVATYDLAVEAIQAFLKGFKTTAQRKEEEAKAKATKEAQKQLREVMEPVVTAQLAALGYVKPTPSYIYTLELENGNYYVGWTNELHQRMMKHFTGQGAVWTKHNKPRRIISIESAPITRERTRTLEVMKEHGIHNVRGACWVVQSLSEGMVKAIEKAMGEELIDRTYGGLFLD